MKENLKLTDVFDNWMTGGGIFSFLDDYTVPWKDESIALELDLAYYGNISGDKTIGPMVRKIMTGDVLTDAEKTVLSTVIMALCGVNWSKEWETLQAEYDPIQNYSMVETMTDDETVDAFGHVNTRTLDTDHAKTGTETATPDLTVNRDNGYYGFNSDLGVPLSDQEQKTTGTNEVEYDTSETDTGSITDTESGRNTHTRNYELTRAGNIGVTTSQQMLQSERDLWMWNYFYDVVFPDLDRVLAIAVY